ncbi:MAG: IS3 family transposase [Chloroflexota bacterium]
MDSETNELERSENEKLQAQIHRIWQQFRQCYGAPRIHAELQAQGCSVGKNRLA